MRWKSHARGIYTPLAIPSLSNKLGFCGLLSPSVADCSSVSGELYRKWCDAFFLLASSLIRCPILICPFAVLRRYSVALEFIDTTYQRVHNMLQARPPHSPRNSPPTLTPPVHAQPLSNSNTDPARESKSDA